MRFVAVKTEEQQARAMLFRTRDLPVRQRTQLINALRGQLSEHGVVAPQGPANVAILAQAIDDMTPSLPLLVVELARVYLDQIDRLSKKVAGLEKAIACEAKRGAMTRRLQTMPGVGPITAMAIETFAPPMEVFRRGRHFAAWLGLVPLQHSTGGKQVLGKTSKSGGQSEIRQCADEVHRQRVPPAELHKTALPAPEEHVRAHRSPQPGWLLCRLLRTRHGQGRLPRADLELAAFRRPSRSPTSSTLSNADCARRR